MNNDKCDHYNFFYACLLTLLLYACQPVSIPAPVQTGTSSPAPSPEATCYLQPQPTGEKVIPPNIEISPPARAHPGDSISIHFSGGYIISNNARVCGENNIIGYIHTDELPSFSYRRTVHVFIDHQTLTAIECDNECPLEVVIPADTPLGMHRLTLWIPYRLVFDIEIIDEGTPSP